MKKTAGWVVAAILMAGPFSFLVLDDAGGEIWALSGLAGIAVGCAMWRQWWPQVRSSTELKVCMAVLALYLAVSFLNYFIVDSSDFAISRAKRQLLLVGAPLMFLTLWWLRLRLQTLLIFIALNAVAFGLYAIWYSWSFDGRVNGVTHAVHFGNVSLFLGFASLALLPVSRHPGLRLLAIAGLVLGGCASVLSGARGGWLAAPIAIMIALIMVVRVFRPRRYIIVGLVGLIALGLVGLCHVGPVQTRIDQAQQNFAELSTNHWSNSIGLRLTMWQQAWLEVREAPLFGTGFSGYRHRVYTAVDAGVLPKDMIRFSTEPHSDYLYHWATRGTIGLLLFIGSLGGAGWYFARLFSTGDRSAVAVAQVGLSLVAIVAIGGLTITIVDQREVIRFLGWTMAVLMYCIWRRGAGLEHQEQTD